MSHPRARLLELSIEELSGVDRPCHKPATVALMKRAPVAKTGVTDEKTAAPEVAALLVAADDPAKSTRTAADAIVTPQPEIMMTTEAKDTTITELTAKLAKADRLATLTDAQRAHYKSLGTDGEGFIAKSFADRESVLAEIEKANEVVYTSTSTGETFRKSDDQRLVTMAKRQDEQAVELAKRDVEIEKSEIRSIAKARIPNLPGADDVHDLIVKSIRKSGAPAEQIEAALVALSGANAAMVSLGKAKGVNPGEDAQTTSLADQAEQLATKYATDHKVDIVKARAAIYDTPEGIALYKAHETAKRSRATA